jgi:hypothetical protein
MSVDADYASVSLLLHCNGTTGSTTFTDRSPSPHTVTVTGIAVSTAQAKFGSGSALAASSGKYFTLDGSAAFAFGTGDYTIEFQIYPTAPGNGQYLYDSRPQLGTGQYPVIYMSSSANIVVEINETTVITGTAPTANTWTHIAVCRSGTSTRLFLNGTQAGSTFTGSNNLVNGTNRPAICQFGNNIANPNGLIGYMDEIRVTKGVARYTANFTAPTEEFYIRDNIVTAITGNSPVTINPTSVQRKTILYPIVSSLSIQVIPVSTLSTLKILNISDNVQVVDSQISDFIFNIIDSINTLSSFDNTVYGNNTIVDNLQTISELLVTIIASISESVVLSDSINNILVVLKDILELNTFNSSTSSSSIFINTIIDIVNLLDILDKGIKGDISESITILDSMSIISNLLSTIIEALIHSDTINSNSVIMLFNSDNVGISSSVQSSALLASLVQEGIIISIPTARGQDTYLGYVLSPETNSISTYDNYNFDGVVNYNGNYLLYNSSGMYKYGGVLDDSSKITSYIETVAYNFNSSNLKQVPSVYLGVSSTGTFILKVRVDGKAETTYKLNKNTNNLQTQKIDIGKGMIGRYFQFELITDADTFNMESVEFYPVEMKRKL